MADPYTHDDEESQALLPSTGNINEKPIDRVNHVTTRRSFNYVHIGSAFLVGLVSSLAVQQFLLVRLSPPIRGSASRPVAYASPWVGSSVQEPFPPASPTNAFPELFPTNVGHAGPTPTGAEPGLVATAPSLPVYTQAPHLVVPLSVTKDKQAAIKGGKEEDWDLFKKWGNLSPWYSVPQGAFGVDAGGEVPEGCSVTGLHLLHRHGARYPTGWGRYTSLVIL